ncbi:hypothetical protein HN460_04155 [bacterium]|jgi:hypothetical protein|nr:hypothetical protein [bacterium]MBT3795249.1 hypothetical protein [bacterium]MBT4634105.1 hypothetical protein [bacterium]
MLTSIIKKKDTILLLALAILIFHLIFGFHLIDFENIYWLPDDAYNGFLGWSFYRGETFFSFPLFKIFNYGSGVGSTIIYTDSLPILAILFKPFSNLLPVNFQYFGLWIFISTLLTSFFMNKILTYYGIDLFSKIMLTIIILLSPIVLERFIAGHINLMSHWIILAGIYLYIRRKQSFTTWLLIILFSILVHGYLFAMTISIAIFSYIKEYLINQDIKKCLRYIAVTILFSSISLYIFGYFEVQADEVFHGGWGGYRLNLLSFMNPIGRSLNWSQLTGDLFAYEALQLGDLIEGFNYFGLGLLISIVGSIYFGIKKKFNFIDKKVKVLIGFSILLFIFAVTNKVGLGGSEFFTYNMPEVLKPLTKPFRASARFFWPIYYLLSIGSIIIIYKQLKTKYAMMFIFIICCIQIVDIYPGIKTIMAFNNKNNIQSIRKMDTTQEELTFATKYYNKIIYVFPEYANHNWRELTYFAYKNKKKTNFGYFARRNWNIQKKYIEDIKVSFKSGKLDKDSVYYFSDIKVFNQYYDKVSSKSKKLVITDLNGIKHMILVPNK